MDRKGKKAQVKEEKTSVINVRVTPTEREIIERLAREEGVTVSQYVRGTVIADWLLTGDSEAIKYSLSVIGSGLKEVVRSKVFNQHSKGQLSHES